MKPLTLLYDRELRHGLSISGYRLVPGYPGTLRLPLEAFLNLYAIDEAGNARLIDGPEALSPLVTCVGSGDEAWSFFRLFTTPETHYYFQKGDSLLELRVGESVPREVVTISSQTAADIRYEPPTITHVGAEYLATRMLVRGHGARLRQPVEIIRRREGISTSGRYRVIEEKTVARLPRTVITLPQYE